MQSRKTLRLISQGYILLSALSLLSVSLMAFSNPQSVMNLVNVHLNNHDAYSSIRGVYGGVGLCLFISLLYLLWNELRKGLAFLSMLWGFYALSRLVTIAVEGPLGAFGTQWLVTETVLFVLASSLWWLNKPSVATSTPFKG